MNETTSTTDTDTFLLVLNDPEFVRVGALLGLRARATDQADSQLVDSFIDSDVQFSGARRKLLVTSVPNILPQ
jgi:hypothetical protein